MATLPPAQYPPRLAVKAWTDMSAHKIARHRLADAAVAAGRQRLSTGSLRVEPRPHPTCKPTTQWHTQLQKRRSGSCVVLPFAASCYTAPEAASLPFRSHSPDQAHNHAACFHPSIHMVATRSTHPTPTCGSTRSMTRRPRMPPAHAEAMPGRSTSSSGVGT